MPSLGDSALIFLLALLLFGPKKLPELARQLGKLMGEFRRASNEFRMQMDEELRVSEQEERQKKIAAIEAAAPVATPAVPAIAVTDAAAGTIAQPAVAAEPVTEQIAGPIDAHPHMIVSDAPLTHTPMPIATAGEVTMMPPSTGLPIGRSSASADLTPMLESIPQEPEPPARHTGSLATETHTEAQLHG